MDARKESDASSSETHHAGALGSRVSAFCSCSRLIRHTDTERLLSNSWCTASKVFPSSADRPSLIVK